MARYTIRICLLAILVSLSLALSSCGEASEEPQALERSSTSEEPQALERSSTLADLANVQELQALFNNDEGIPRLILLLSPT